MKEYAGLAIKRAVSNNVCLDGGRFHDNGHDKDYIVYVNGQCQGCKKTKQQVISFCERMGDNKMISILCQGNYYTLEELRHGKEEQRDNCEEVQPGIPASKREDRKGCNSRRQTKDDQHQ